MRRTITFRPFAESDLAELFDYISASGGRKRAVTYVTSLRTFCLQLSEYPERGRRRDDLWPGIRSISFRRRATITFRVEGDTVEIVRIFHAGRDYGAEDFDA